MPNACTHFKGSPHTPSQPYIYKFQGRYNLQCFSKHSGINWIICFSIWALHDPRSDFRGQIDCWALARDEKAGDAYEMFHTTHICHSYSPEIEEIFINPELTMACLRFHNSRFLINDFQCCLGSFYVFHFSLICCTSS